MWVTSLKFRHKRLSYDQVGVREEQIITRCDRRPRITCGGEVEDRLVNVLDDLHGREGRGHVFAAAIGTVIVYDYVSEAPLRTNRGNAAFKCAKRPLQVVVP